VQQGGGNKLGTRSAIVARKEVGRDDGDDPKKKKESIPIDKIP